MNPDFLGTCAGKSVFFRAMQSSVITDFEQEVSQNLVSCGVSLSASITLGAAVSGGADSISLITALSHIIPNNVNLIAVTVNHNMRELCETAGDADFTEAYCKRIGVQCVRYEVPRGKIFADAKEKDLSEEESARVARYELFERFMQSYRVDYLCLAHNQNDQKETLLMRFLSGGGTASLAGIRMRRQSFVRPLLSISRARIESYLAQQGILYRTDSSNADNRLFRNRMRNVIMPALDESVPGWGTAVLSLAGKMADDEAFLSDAAEQVKSRVSFAVADGAAVMSLAELARVPKALKVRLLYAAANAAGCSGRIPYSFISTIADKITDGCTARWQESVAEVLVTADNGKLFVGKAKKIATESGFLAIIRNDGDYTLSALHLRVKASKSGEHSGMELQARSSAIFVPALHFPFIIRSRQAGDVIRTAGGGSKTVAAVLKDWKCDEKKDLIPLLQRLDTPEQDIVAIWGDPYGFKNWIVKN